MRYTDDPSYLLPTSIEDIKHTATREGVLDVTELELDLVQDLLAKASGARVAKFDEGAAMLDAEIYALLEVDAFKRRHPQINAGRAERLFRDNYHSVQHQLYDLLVHLDLSKVPGYNYLTKAIRVIKLVRSVKVIWVIYRTTEVAMGTLFRAVNNALERVKFLTSEERDLLTQFADPLSGDPELDTDFLGVELQLNGINLPEMFRIARHLDTLSEFARGRSKLLPDPDGEDVKLRPIETLAELGKVGQQDLGLPPALRNMRAVQGQFDVRAPHTRRLKKQLLFVVADGTQSMLEHGAVSASRAAGVLLNRLQAVIDGDAELFVRFFDRNLREQEYHAKDLESARELMRIVSDPAQYMGSWTEFKATLTSASGRVEELMKPGTLRVPEMMLVTDGKAKIPEDSALKGNLMHLVQVGKEEIEELSAFARRSGGVSIYAGVTLGM